MEKPVRREELAIPPRLAKIMINLSMAKKWQTLVDPFCGVGVILQEALSQEIKVIGIDKDPQAVEGLRKNISWHKFSRENYQLLNADSSRVKIKKCEAIVTEPDLGQILKNAPNLPKAKEMLDSYENLMIRVLNNIKGSIEGRFVFTSPFIKTSADGRTKRIGCNREKILGKTGLRLVSGFPVTEFRENQVVGREIFVLEH